MSIKIALVAVFLANTAVGHLCMMPMAYAASVPISHDEAMEMTMTPIEPMSPAHCEHCARIAKEQPIPMSTGCAGHCLSRNAGPVASVSATSQMMQVSAALPPSAPSLVTLDGADHLFIASTTPPVLVSMTRTIVLLE